jgi:O-antigen ligase
MKGKFLQICEYMPAVLMGFLIIFSLFYPDSNKFDFAKSIMLILIFGICNLFITVNFVFYKKEKIRFDKFDILQFVFLFIYIGLVLISFFVSKTANFGFGEVFVLLSSALLFLNIKRGLFNVKLWNILYLLSIFVTLFTCIYGYILYFYSPHDRDLGLFYNPLISGAAWPNAFATFLLMTWPLVFHFVFFKKSSFLKLLILSFILASFFLTFSRAAFVAFFGQIFCFILYKIFSVYYKKISFLDLKNSLKVNLKNIVIIVFFIFIFTSIGQMGRAYFRESAINFKDRITFQEVEQNTSVSERLNFWKGGIALVAKSPIFGFGPNSFVFIYRSIQKDWLAIADHPHNLFLKIAVDSGLIATMSFSAFLIVIFVNFLISFKKNKDKDNFLIISLFLCFLGAILHNLVDYTLNFITNYLIFWLIIGALSCFIKTDADVRKYSKISLSYILVFIFVFVSLLGFASYESVITLYGRLAARALAKNEIVLADKYFAIYDRTLFSRYLYWDDVDRMLGRGNILKAESYYLEYAEKNSYDSVNFYRLAILYRDNFHDFQNAKKYFFKALFLDSKNYWSYYLDYAAVLEKLGLYRDLRDLTLSADMELLQYMPKIKQNLHYTANTQNPYDLMKFLDYMLKYGDLDEKEYFEVKQTILDAVEKYKKIR